MEVSRDTTVLLNLMDSCEELFLKIGKIFAKAMKYLHELELDQGANASIANPEGSENAESADQV